jgi:transaldolase
MSNSATHTQTTSITQLHQLGQQIYYDGMSRADIASGKIGEVIAQGASGLTSNPAIFQKSFEKVDYDEQVGALLKQNPTITPAEIFEACAVADIQKVCDAFFTVFQKTNGVEGYVSLEVSPLLAGNHAATQVEARRLWASVNRPNLFIKIPSTDIAVLRPLTAEGVQINVTLLFTVEDTLSAAKEILAGLQDRLSAGKDISVMQSVLSHFVSRIDAVANKKLDESIAQGDQVAESLRQQVGVLNSYRAHYEMEQLKKSPAYQKLLANFPKLLLASTGRKEERYPHDVYVAALALPGTINTVPTATYEEVIKMAKTYAPASYDIQKVLAQLAQFEKYISLNQICVELKKDGVKLFADAYQRIIQIIETKLPK